MSECVKCGKPALADKPTCAEHAPDSIYIEGIGPEGVRPALPQPCDMCPWRIANQTGDPPQHEGSEPWYYTETTRRAMWESYGPHGEGLSDGVAMFCHRTGPMEGTSCRVVAGSKVHECTGGVALQQRALIRAVRTRELAPLRGIGPRAIAARMLNVLPNELRSWKLNGRQITGDELIRAAHPAVLDPLIGSEQVPPPTEGELAEWSRHRG